MQKISEKEMKAIFAKRLSDLLRKRNMTQRELADRVGCTESAMSRYIRGERTPRISVVVRIALETDITSDYLLGIERREV